MSAQSVPVSPGSLPPISVQATDSVGDGSAYDIEADLFHQMDDLAQTPAGIPSMFPPAEFGGYAEPEEEGYGDDEFEGEEDGWGAYHSGMHPAQQDFVQATARFASSMGYDVPSPFVEGDAGPMGQQNGAGSAWDNVEESAIDAFNRQAAMGASSMGYDVPSPNTDQGGFASFPDPVTVGTGQDFSLPSFAPAGVAPSPGPVLDEQNDFVGMTDASKRGRIIDASSPAASSVRAAKRVAPSTTPGPSAACPPSAFGSCAASSSQADEIAVLEVTCADLFNKARASEEKAKSHALQVVKVSADASAAIGTAQKTANDATAALAAVRAEMAAFGQQAATFKAELESGHATKLAELRAEAALFRTQSEALLAKSIDDIRSAAEARHRDAMEAAATAFRTKEAFYHEASNTMREQCLSLQRSALSQRDAYERDKQQLRDRVTDLMSAAAVASLGPVGGTSGVPSDVQERLDRAIHTVEALGIEIKTRDGKLIQFDTALRAEKSSAQEKHVKELAFQNFVDGREKSLRGEIAQLNQKVFMLEYVPDDSGTAVNNDAIVRCSALDAANRVLKAQLAAATALVEQYRVPQQVPLRPTPSLPIPRGPAVDIRHPTLHSSFAPGGSPTLLRNTVSGGNDEFHSANSLDEWYGTGAALPSPSPAPNLHSLGFGPQCHSMCGSGVATDMAAPKAPFVRAAPVFNAFQQGAGLRPPLPSEDPARFRAPGALPQPLRAPGPNGPPEFRPQQHPPAREALPTQFTGMPQPRPFPPQHGFTQYEPPEGFRSFVSDFAVSEAPPHGEGGLPPDGTADSSDYISEPDDDPNNPLGNAARRAKAARQWRTYREFNGALTIATIPDHASKFKHWKDVVRNDIASVSKAGQKGYNWILRVENNLISDDTLRVCKRKWEPLDSKIRSALTKVATGEVQKMLELLTEEERLKHHRQISGAYMLRMIYRRFQTKNSLSQFYDFSDLQKVTFRNDMHLEAFLQEWRSKLNGFEKPEHLPSAARLDMFVRQLKGSALMKYDMEVHKRKEDPDTDRAYATLVHNVEAQIREQRNHRVETQLGQGTHLPPALPAPPGTLCRYFTEGTCRKGDHCDMVHCEVTKRAHKPSANPPPGGTGDKGAGRGGGVAKGGGKGQPQAKAAPGPGGRSVGTKGGNATSKFPCYANYVGKCLDAACKLCHRTLTPAEVTVWEAWKLKQGTRAASPGAPATGICPDFLRGTCALGAGCSMAHPEESKTARKKAAAKAKAAAAAGP